MKRILRKKRFLFPIIFFAQILIAAVVGIVFELETTNSPLGATYAVVMVVTIIYFLVKIIKDHKTVLTDVKIPFLGLSVIWILYLAIFSTVMASVLAGLMVLFGAV